MPNEVAPYEMSSSLLRDARRAARVISRHHAQKQVRVAATDCETDAALAKVDSATAVVGHAMGAATRLAQLQKQLETLAPEVSGSLTMLTTVHLTGLVEITADHQRALRRR